MHGFYNGIDFVNKILNNADCVRVQEHWEREQFLSVFHYIDANFASISFSSMNEDDLHANGRSYGGLAILYGSNKIKFKNLIYVLINEYLPLYLMS